MCQNPHGIVFKRVHVHIHVIGLNIRPSPALALTGHSHLRSAHIPERSGTLMMCIKASFFFLFIYLFFK